MDKKTNELFIEQIKSLYSKEKVIDTINMMEDVKVTVIGDTIIDEYHFLEPYGLASKSVVPSTRFIDYERHSGGSLAISNHICNFTNNVELITDFGESKNIKRHIKESLNPTIRLHSFTEEGRVFTCKRRYLSRFQNNKILEISDFNKNFFSESRLAEISNQIHKSCSRSEMVVLADFGHYFINPSMISLLIKESPFLCLNVQTNSSNRGFNLVNKYEKADYLCIDEIELRLALSNRDEKMGKLAKKIFDKMNYNNVCVTLGINGSVSVNDQESYNSLAIRDGVVDTTGSGDSFLSISSLALFLTKDIRLSTFLGTCAGFLTTKYLGNSDSLSKEKLKDLVEFIFEE